MKKSKYLIILIFLFVGRIMRNKNIEFLAENLNKKYFSQNIKIYIIGDIIDEVYYKELKNISI